MDSRLRRHFAHVAGSCLFADQDAPFIPYAFRRDMFIRFATGFLNGVCVHAAFVREDRFAHKRLTIIRREIGHFADEMRQMRQLPHFFIRDDWHILLQLQIRQHGNQIAIAVSLTKSIDSSLHLRRASIHRRERICHAQFAIIMRVDSDFRAKSTFHFGHSFGDKFRHTAAIGVAQNQHFRAAILRGFQCLHGIFAAAGEGIKKMFAIIKHATSLAHH